MAYRDLIRNAATTKPIRRQSPEVLAMLQKMKNVDVMKAAKPEGISPAGPVGKAKKIKPRIEVKFSENNPY